MSEKELMPVIFEVLKNPYAIGTTITVILLMNFCCFVANYRKKPPKPKPVKKAPAPAPAAKPAEGEATQNENTESTEKKAE
ncbi:MAG: hypothetical protein IJL70_10325 [Treponema sp.]|nr:hypothetical protein [Treponema sp.]